MLVVFLLISYKLSKYTQILLTIFYMIFTVLVHELVVIDLTKNQLFYLGVYVTILYFYLIKGTSLMISTFAFSFMLLYFTFKFLETNEDIITLSSHFVICALQSYMIFMDKKRKEKLIEKKNKEKEKFIHIVNEILPGISILLRVSKTENSVLKRALQKVKNEHVILDFINNKGIEDFRLNDITSVLNFMKKITVTNSTMKSSEIDDGSTQNQNLCQLIKNEVENFDILGENLPPSQTVSFGLFPSVEKYIKIKFANFLKDGYCYIFIQLENDAFDTKKLISENTSKKNFSIPSLSHDLNTPLNEILGFVKNAQECSDVDQRNFLLDLSMMNGELLSLLINDIMDYSNLLNEKFRLNKEKFILRNLLSEVYSILHFRAASKNISFKIRNEFDNCFSFSTDSVRLKQILVNFLLNSIKCTFKGSIILRIKKTNHSRIIKFVIIDTGIGIPNDNIEQLIQSMNRIEIDEEERNIYGLGLGMTICRKLIAQLGPQKSFKIKSKLGEGTKISFLIYLDLSFKKFTSTRLLSNKKNVKVMKGDDSPTPENLINIKDHDRSFPFEAKNIFGDMMYSYSQRDTYKDANIKDLQKQFTQKNDSCRSSNQCSLESEPAFNKTKIPYSKEKYKLDNLILKLRNSKEELFTSKVRLNFLIADDNQFNTLKIISILSKQTQFIASFETVSNGLECLEKFKEKNLPEKNKEKYDILVLDCFMPIKDGFSLSKEIKSLVKEKEYQDAYIIGCSWNQSEEIRKKCNDCEMDSFMLKPVDESLFILKVEEFLHCTGRNLNLNQMNINNALQ